MKKSTGSGKAAANELRDMVGVPMYDAWVAQLAALVPGGRTHRLAVIVAGMLTYAAGKVESDDDRPFAQALEATNESADPDDFPDEVRTALEQLFRDVGVSSQRSSKKGESYSIITEALMEYANWESYAWD